MSKYNISSIHDTYSSAIVIEIETWLSDNVDSTQRDVFGDYDIVREGGVQSRGLMIPEKCSFSWNFLDSSELEVLWVHARMEFLFRVICAIHQPPTYSECIQDRLGHCLNSITINHLRCAGVLTGDFNS